MAIPIQRPHRVLPILATCMVLAACGSDSTRPGGDEPPEEFPDGLETVSCTGLSLASSSGVPLDRIDAGTVPAALEPPLAVLVLPADGSTPGAGWLEVDGDGRVELVTPLHPSGSIEGGEVLIRATDGRVACEPWTFTVQPLPPSPGEMAAVVDGLQEILAGQAALLGTTPEMLKATPLEGLPRVLAPLAVVQWVLDHPDNPSSLRALADGSSPEQIQGERVDALLARAGLREALEAGLSGVSPRHASPGTPQAQAVDPEDCTPQAIGEDTQRLIDCSRLGEPLTEEIEEVLLDRGPALAQAVLLESALPAVWSGEVRNVLAGIAWAALEERFAAIRALPTAFDQPTVEVDPPRFAEDDTATGVWSASLTARSQGAGVDEIQLSLAALTSASAYRGLDALAGAGLVPESFDAGAAVRRLVVGPVLEFLEGESIPAEVFGPVPLDDERWSGVSYEPITGGGPSVDRVAFTTYRPVAVGRTEVVITPKTEAFGAFGSPGPGRAEVEVDSLVVRMEPSDTIVAPGDTIDFRVTVENALTKGPLEAFLFSGASSGTLVAFEDVDATRYRLRVRATPVVDDAEVLLVDVVDRSTEGARANGPLRAARARARIAYVSITTLSECTDVGGPPIQMETRKSEWIEASDLVWDARLGTVSSTGLYTPPSTAGVDTVTVALRDEPRIRDFLIVPVGGCSCQATFTVDGMAPSTSSLRFTLTNDLSAVGAVSWRGGTFEQVTFGFGAEPRTPGSVGLGFTGNVQQGGGVSGVVDETRFLNPDDPDDPAVEPLTVVIRENTGSVLSGNFSGQIAIPTNDTIPRIAPLRFDFYIVADPFLSSDQVKACEVPDGGS